MSPSPFRFAVFTKPWPLPIPELGAKIRALGFDGIELPVRPGFPVNPDNMAAELPRAAVLLKREFGLTIESVAGSPDKSTVAACAEASVSLIRICPTLQKGESYLDAETRHRREWDALVPHLARHKVTLGIQNHSGRCLPVNALGLARALQGFDPKHVAAVWDPAHEALEGTEAEMALDVIAGPLLRMVNLKNGFKRNVAAPSEPAAWKTYWTSGEQGLANWPRVVADLKRRGWSGPVCLSAEYSDGANVDRLIAEDVAYARTLFR